MRPGNIVTARYLQGAHGPIKSLISNNYFYQDSLGSTSHLASSTGALLEYYKYDLNGKPTYWSSTSQQLNSSAFSIVDLFAGERYIPEISLYDDRNRFMSPDLGRFLQPDPIGFKGDGSNLYRYCGNDWANRTDPSGLNYSMDGDTVNIPWKFEWRYPHTIPVPQTFKDDFLAGQNSLTGQHGLKWNAYEATHSANVVHVADGKGKSSFDWTQGSNSVFCFAEGGRFGPNGPPVSVFEGGRHVGGHAVGLDDRYDKKTFTPKQGYEDNIMGGLGKNISKHDANLIRSPEHQRLTNLGIVPGGNLGTGRFEAAGGLFSWGTGASGPLFAHTPAGRTLQALFLKTQNDKARALGESCGDAEPVIYNYASERAPFYSRDRLYR